MGVYNRGVRAAALALALAFAAGGPDARAEYAPVESLDYRVASADVVFTGTVVRRQPIPWTGGGWQWTRYDVATEERLRGSAPLIASVFVRGDSTDSVWTVPGQRLLVFTDTLTSRADEVRGMQDAARSALLQAPAPLLATRGICHLDDPGNGALALSDAPPFPVVTREMQVIGTGTAILAAARRAAVVAEPVLRGKHNDDPLGFDDTGQAAHRLLYRGSAVHVAVPIDAELIAQADRLLGERPLYLRLRGAKVFASWHSPYATDRLQRLLADPGAYPSRRPDGSWRRTYAVRALAKRALEQRGEHVRPVVIEESMPAPTPRRP